MAKAIYLDSDHVAEIFFILGNAFMTYRDAIGESQYKNNCCLADVVMGVILQHNLIADDMLHPLVRDLIRTVIVEPALYKEWTNEGEDYFAEQLELNFSKTIEIP